MLVLAGSTIHESKEVGHEGGLGGGLGGGGEVGAGFEIAVTVEVVDEVVLGTVRAVGLGDVTRAGGWATGVGVGVVFGPCRGSAFVVVAVVFGSGGGVDERISGIGLLLKLLLFQLVLFN